MDPAAAPPPEAFGLRLPPVARASLQAALLRGPRFDGRKTGAARLRNLARAALLIDAPSLRASYPLYATGLTLWPALQGRPTSP